MKGFATKAVHGPGLHKDSHGALRPPLYDSVAFEFENSKDLESAFLGKKNAHTYSRITNPTVTELEQRIQLLHQAYGVLAVASGMAAITNTVLALARSGSNIITTKNLFGNTFSLFTQTLQRWGLEIRFADFTKPESFLSYADENTAMVFLESISNPQLEVNDIPSICRQAAKHSIPVVLDGTLTTPLLFDSKSAGVAVEIISSTKYISGGATSVGGLIIDNGIFDWSKNPLLLEISGQTGPGAFLVRLRREVYRNTGACLSAHNAWLQILGLETFSLRVRQSCSNAVTVVQYLQTSGLVKRVNYPGMLGSTGYTAAQVLFKNGFGSLLTFELSDKQTCFRFMDHLKLIRKSTNLQDNKTLIIHPASTIFSEFSLEERLKMGVPEGLMRLSVGIEDPEDILEDIASALGVLT